MAAGTDTVMNSGTDSLYMLLLYRKRREKQPKTGRIRVFHVAILQKNGYIDSSTAGRLWL